jgi:ribosomal protein L24
MADEQQVRTGDAVTVTKGHYKGGYGYVQEISVATGGVTVLLLGQQGHHSFRDTTVILNQGNLKLDEK